ncbi:MAG: GNAT family N-acetyltransferase [Thermoplasmata archaeon]
MIEIYSYYLERSAATFELVPVRPADQEEWFREHLGGGRHRIVIAAGEGGRVLGWATSSRFRPRAAYDTTVESSV